MLGFVTTIGFKTKVSKNAPPEQAKLKPNQKKKLPTDVYSKALL